MTSYLAEIRYQGDPNSEQVDTAAFGVLLVLVNATLKFFKIQAAQAPDAPVPDGATGGNYDPYTDLGNALVVCDLVFVYFFVAARFTLLLMAVLMALQFKQKKGKNTFRKGDWTATVFRVVVRIGLALVACVKMDEWKEERFLYSAWMVPTVMLGVGMVVVGDGVMGWVFSKAKEEEGDQQNGKDKRERRLESKEPTEKKWIGWNFHSAFPAHGFLEKIILPKSF